MSASTASWIILILVILLLLAISFLVSNLLIRRALRAVIKMFRDTQSITPETAKMAEDIGFKKHGLLQFRGLRDYKPTALQFLMKNEVVRSTEDGRLFLSEETLAQTGIEIKIGVK